MVLRQLLKLKEEYFGSGAVMFRWNTSASRLACVPAARPSNVFIFDSSGEIERDVPLDDRTSPVSSFEWDTTGNVLALIQKGVVTVSIYHFDEDRLETLDCSREEPSFIAWNMTGPQLAIGTSKGNTIIYNSTTAKMQLIAGKHGRRITCGAWTLRGHLLLGSDDKIISLSDTEGETLRQTVLRSAPMTMRVADEIIAGNAISFDKGGLSAKCCVRTGKDSLILLETEAMSIVATVKFSQKYGSIVDYGWFGDERLCIGYSGGQVVVTPTSGDEIGQEVFRCKPASSLDALSLCSIPSKAGGFSVLWAAVAGDGCIKIIDLRDCREETESTINYEDDDEAGVVSNLTFSRGGQTITFNVSTGCVYSYLARLPLMFEARGNSVAWLSSLREITVTEIVDGKQRSGKNAEKVKIECEVEPAIIGVGPRQIAAGAGRRVYYHSLRDGQKTEREYPAKVEAVELSQSHAAVLAEGKIYIHSLKGSPAVTVLPAEGSKGDDGVKILSMRMTPQDILIYSTSGKELVHYDVEERCPINEYRHTESILAVYPNSLGGTYTAFLDAKGVLQVYNAVTEVSLSPVDHDRVGKIRGVLWDLADPSVFVVAADAREAAVLELHTFVVYDYSLSGPTVVPVGGAIRRSEVFYDSIDFESGRDDPTTLAHGEIPVAVQNGRVTVQCRQPGELRTSDLASHSGIGSALRRMSNTNSGPVDVEEMERVVMRLAALGRMELAYRVCLSIPRKEKMGADEGGRDELMRLIARQAVELLEVDMAILAYRECGDADRVAFLDRLVQLEDVPMLQGYLKVLLGQKQAAIESFVRAGAPREALDVMCDSQMWESAKGLATTVDQRRLPMIHRHVAMGLEDKGDYEGALASYKEAIGEVDESRVEDAAEHFRACNAGLARCLCYCGMYEPAARLCERIAEEDVLIECAAILERMKQYSLAGRLHQRLGNLERACSLYIQDMDFDAAKPLMDQVSTPKLHLLYAKAKEARGFFKEAAASYEKGGDMESIVRLLVDESQLNDPRKAMDLIRKGIASSTGAAEIVADYCRRVGDITGSIEFLARARLDEMAFEMAVRHDQMPVYERTLAESEGSDELVGERYRSVAGYYKERNLPLEAAKNYVLCGEYEVAMELCLSLDQTNVSVDDTAASVAGGGLWKLSPHMDLAIDIAGRCHDEGLVNRLVDHLLRANTGLEDDELGYHQAQSIYKLHQVLGNYEESARIAMLIAKREQDEGRYKAAQSLLLKTYKDLDRLKMRIPREMWERLMLLQSYILVKPLAQLDEHVNAALLLKRICQGNVLQSFRKHAAQTLASAVIECMKSGMKAEAHAYACELMRDAELRNRIPEQLRKKIEVVVRKPPKGDQQGFQEPLSPCPYCATPLPDSSLSCGHCQNIVPFCAVTGLHVVLSDWSSPCGNCLFPMRYSTLERMMAHEKSIVCPMCSEELAASAVTKLSPEDALEEAEKFKRSFTRTMSTHENRS